MSALGPDLPAFAAVERALRAATERLAREVVDPDEIPPTWSDFEWSIARAVATMHGFNGLLAHRAHWNSPPEWPRRLLEQREQIAAIQRKVRALIERIDRATRAAGIACIPLKGSALLGLDLLVAGERSMGDVDLLVRPRDCEALAEVMHSLGYLLGYVARRHATYRPAVQERNLVFGEHRDNPLRIEVHMRVSESLPFEHVEITDAIWPVRAMPGVNPYASLAALLRHLLLHAAGNMRARALRFIQLHDISRLSARLGDDDWRALLGRRNAADGPWWLYPPLVLTERYLPRSIPAAVLAQARAACPRWLRARSSRQSLYDVSWSNLRIQALPGIEWARSPLEAARFARSRLMPSRQARRELADGVRTLPELLTVPWYQLPHASRIMRWLISRPPRVQTLVQIRAALAREPVPADQPRATSAYKS